MCSAFALYSSNRVFGFLVLDLGFANLDLERGHGLLALDLTELLVGRQHQLAALVGMLAALFDFLSRRLPCGSAERARRCLLYTSPSPRD